MTDDITGTDDPDVVRLSDPTDDPDSRFKNTLVFAASMRHRLLEVLEELVVLGHGVGVDLADVIEQVPPYTIGIVTEDDGDDSVDRFLPLILPSDADGVPVQRVLEFLHRGLLLEPAGISATLAAKLLPPDLLAGGLRPLGFAVVMTAQGWQADSQEEMDGLVTELRATLGKESETVPSPQVFDYATCTVAVGVTLHGERSSVVVDPDGNAASVRHVFDATSPELGGTEEHIDGIAAALGAFHAVWKAEHAPGT